MKRSFSSIATKTAIVHTVTYFVIGLIVSFFLDYSARYAEPIVSRYMRQVSDPWVAAGPMFQLLRGFLFGIVFYALRDTIFPNKRGSLPVSTPYMTSRFPGLSTYILYDFGGIVMMSKCMLGIKERSEQ